MIDPIRITHFSDVLCVWAYVHQARMDELAETFGEQIVVDYRFLQVFGDLRRVEERWRERGGLPAYNDHVKEVVAGFEHVDVHPEIWRSSAPWSSLPCHLFLCAVRVLEARGTADGGLPAGTLVGVIEAIRGAFFARRIDVARRAALLEIAESLELPVASIEECLASGEAHATLSGDFQLAAEQGVRISPTLVFNEGRQRLTGNVGYRVIEANIRELLSRPAGQHSWC